MAAISAEHLPANGAAGLEGENSRDLSPAHLVILAEAAIQVGLNSAIIHQFGLCYAIQTHKPNDIASYCICASIPA